MNGIETMTDEVKWSFLEMWCDVMWWDEMREEMKGEKRNDKNI